MSNAMRKTIYTILDKILPAPSSIRRRMFFLIGGASLGALLIANLIWLPSAIDDILRNQRELRQVSVLLIRDQVQVHFEEHETQLRNIAQRFRPFLSEGDREGLCLTAQRFLHTESHFEEIGILDGKGKELIRLSRRTVITDQDLADRSSSTLFREGMKEEIHWEPVTITATSEPWAALTVRLPGSAPSLKGLVYGIINLRTQWKFTAKFKISHQGRVYIVDEKGMVVAAADPSVVLRQLSFADRPFIRRLIDPRNSDDRSFVEGSYLNERGVNIVATGLLLSRPRWGVVVEQPQSVLFSPVRQKIWFVAGLSLMGILISLGLAQVLSRRIMKPIVRLQKGVEQIRGGNLEYRVAVSTDDEIGALARQFNSMAEQIQASHQAILSALTIPVMSHASKIRETLSELIAKVMRFTEAEAASIRLVDDELREIVFSDYRGFSEAYICKRPTNLEDEAGAKKILQTAEPIIFSDTLQASGSENEPLAREGFRSVAYLPLKTSDKTFGFMTLAGREPGLWDAKKTEIFKTVAHQIAIALENAYLFDTSKHAEEARRSSEEEARYLAQENAVIAEIGRIISSSLNIDEVYERFAEEVRKLIPIDRVTINIINPRDNTATTAYISGTELLHRKKGDVYPLASTVTEGVRHTRKSLLINEQNYRDYVERFPYLAIGLQAGFRSLMAIPLISKDEVIGVLQFRSSKLNIYSEKELKLAERVGNQIAGAIANAHLFVERGLLEEERRELQERLHRAEKMEALGTLAGGVAHDLNNVLGVLLGLSELMLEKIPEGNPLKTYVTNILAATEKAAAIIQDLLTLARRGVSVSEVVSINRVISDFQKSALFQKIASYHPGVTFKADLSPELMNIKGSPIHLEKTVMNLITNAVEAISGTGEATIRTENRYIDRPVQGYDSVKEGEYVVLSVADTGGGIPKTDMDKIFEPFYTKKIMGRSGTGLGLAIVWGTVKDHEGYIDVVSEDGKGTTFTLYFPATRKELPREKRQIPVEEYMGKGETILVVDDVAGQRDIAAGILTRLGYKVVKVASGEEALEYLEIKNADLVVLDMIMDPGIDGLETYQRMIAIKPQQKTVIVSGFSETDRVRKMQELGAGAYVQKPYIMEKIGIAVKAELNYSGFKE